MDLRCTVNFSCATVNLSIFYPIFITFNFQIELGTLWGSFGNQVQHLPIAVAARV
jgi:hypothetical protein